MDYRITGIATVNGGTEHLPLAEGNHDLKNAKIILALVTLLIGSSALASCPDNVGVYSTLDGSLLPGRAAEAWCDAPEGPGQPGNTANAMSWNGAELGTQWHIWGMTIDADGATMVSDTVDGDGNGVRIYQTGYEGGEFFLDGSGPWTNDDVDLNGVVYNFLVITSITFVGGNPVAQVSNITFNGEFVDCPENNGCVVEFAIANAILAWNSNMDTPMPENYPGFLCDATMGELFQNNDVSIGINCAVATENMSWTGLKGMYR